MIPMQAILAAAMVFSIVVCFHGAGSEALSISWWVAVSPWIAWIVSPYLPLVLLGRRHVNLARSATLYILTVLVAGFASQVYFDGFYTHLDAQSALLFIFVPLYQWLAILAGGIIYLVVALIRNRIRAVRSKRFVQPDKI